MFIFFLIVSVLVSMPSAYFNEYFLRKVFLLKLEMRRSTELIDHLLQVCVPKDVCPRVIEGQLVVDEFKQVGSFRGAFSLLRQQRNLCHCFRDAYLALSLSHSSLAGFHLGFRYLRLHCILCGTDSGRRRQSIVRHIHRV